MIVALKPRDLVIGDRGYAHRNPLSSVAEAGAFFIVRTNWQNMPLHDDAGQRFDTLAALRSLPDGAAHEFPVVIHAGRKRIAARLVAIRKTEAAAERARKAILKDRRKAGRGLDPQTLEAAAYIYVLTNVPLPELSADEVLELYRFRWQVELVFKRLKTVMKFDELPVKDAELAKMYLYAKLLGAIVIDDLTARYVSFSPWGYPLEPVSVAMAHPEIVP